MSIEPKPISSRQLWLLFEYQKEMGIDRDEFLRFCRWYMRRDLYSLNSREGSRFITMIRMNGYASFFLESMRREERMMREEGMH